MTLQVETVRKLFTYSDGNLIRNTATAHNAKKGNIAGWKNVSTGYRYVSILKKEYLLHRLIWFYHYGYFPENDVDHIDRNVNNNRIENLREVSRSCNVKNKDVRRDSISGVTGVNPYHYGLKYKWRSSIQVDGKSVNLGKFENLLDAVKARHSAEVFNNYPECNSKSSAFLFLRNLGEL